jgi:hypothetical protein
VALAAAERRFPGQRMLVATDFRIQAFAGDPARAQAILAKGESGFSLPPDRLATWKALLAARAEASTQHDDAAYRAFTSDARLRAKGSVEDLATLVTLRRIDEAFALADRLADAGEPMNTELLFPAFMQPLRADPRFMTLATRLGLVPIWIETDQWPDFCAEKSLPYDCRLEAKRAMSAEARPLVASTPVR